MVIIHLKHTQTHALTHLFSALKVGIFHTAPESRLEPEIVSPWQNRIKQCHSILEVSHHFTCKICFGFLFVLSYNFTGLGSVDNAAEERIPPSREKRTAQPPGFC